MEGSIRKNKWHSIKSVDVQTESRPKRESLPSQHIIKWLCPSSRSPRSKKLKKEKKTVALQRPILLRAPPFNFPMNSLEDGPKSFSPTAPFTESSLGFWKSGKWKNTFAQQLNEWVGQNRRLHFVNVMAFFHEWRHALDNNDTFNS